jgi:N-acetylglucosaminyl-diphospho-decaprenol L-rhamnosyltransferase
MISFSIVSHGHGPLVEQLLGDLKSMPAVRGGEIILTQNVPEPGWNGPPADALPLQVVRNHAPRGFGANHNAAFHRSRGDHFCVLNPDVRLSRDPFPALLDALETPEVGLTAPLIVSPGGSVEDSARRFHTPLALLRKAVSRGVRLDYPDAESAFSPDWVAGMFMLFRREAFERVGGFDERYFLYYEDVDICARLRLAGYDVRLVPSVQAVHDARRRSHRELRYLTAHVRSAVRYFTSEVHATVMRRR